MQAGDSIKLSIQSELQGVAMTNILYWEVVDPTNTQGLSAFVNELATAFINSISARLSSALQFSCAVWENLDGNDPVTPVFFSVFGAGGSEALPTHNVIDTTQYGLDPQGNLRFGRIRVSGIDEAQVTRGRLDNAGEMSSLESFLRSQYASANTTPIVKPILFVVDKTAPPNKISIDITEAKTSANIRHLKRRETRLCGV